MKVFDLWIGGSLAVAPKVELEVPSAMFSQSNTRKCLAFGSGEAPEVELKVFSDVVSQYDCCSSLDK